ncbi:hypothetical protein P9265_21175 [Schinkia azotoformans]|uniref:hypothetical protein n=1 Tax=Schinkia azotoformans TaxID=1454 RepID=UPI002E2239D2|nr:hypothetical protein [Schinkia azotoformans]
MNVFEGADYSVLSDMFWTLVALFIVVIVVSRAIIKVLDLFIGTKARSFVTIVAILTFLVTLYIFGKFGIMAF